MRKTEFVDGMFVKKGRVDWNPVQISISVDRHIEWLQKHKNENGYVNIDVNFSQEGSIYAKLNDWKPQSQQGDFPPEATPQQQPSFEVPDMSTDPDEEIPF